MSDLPAGLVGLAARLVDDGRETSAWQPAAERETLSVAPDPALLAATAAPSLDTVQAPSLGPEEPTVVSDFDTALVPAVGSRGTDVLALLSPPPPAAPPVARPDSDPPAPMVIVPSPRAQATTVPAPGTPAPRTTEPSGTIQENKPGSGESRPRTHDAAFFGDERLALGDDAPGAIVVPPSARRSWLPLVLGGVLLLGGGLGLGLYFGRSPTAVPAPDAPRAATTPIDASAPPPVVDAAPPSEAAPASVVDAAVPDAAVPDAAPPSAAPASVARPVRPRAPASQAPEAPVTEAATGALAALDRGRVEAPVEAVAIDTTPLGDLPDTLEQAAIVAVIKGHQRGVHGCYQRQLKRDPGMRQANVKLAFNIERSGQTSNVHIDEKYAGTELATCLERLVRRWRFPAFKGEAIPVEYPLIFTASL